MVRVVYGNGLYQLAYTNVDWLYVCKWNVWYYQFVLGDTHKFPTPHPKCFSHSLQSAITHLVIKPHLENALGPIQ